jgi:adenylate cyclase
LEAYDDFLRGHDYLWRSAEQANARARELLERAISLDPTFAAAYAALGWTYWLNWVFQWDVNPRTLERAFALAQQAIALDEALPMSHRLLSDVYLWNKQHDQAIAAAERAIALDPNDAEGYATLARILSYAGRPEDAIGMEQRPCASTRIIRPYT